MFGCLSGVKSRADSQSAERKTGAYRPNAGPRSVEIVDAFAIAGFTCPDDTVIGVMRLPGL